MEKVNGGETRTADPRFHLGEHGAVVHDAMHVQPPRLANRCRDDQHRADVEREGEDVEEQRGQTVLQLHTAEGVGSWPRATGGTGEGNGPEDGLQLWPYVIEQRLTVENNMVADWGRLDRDVVEVHRRRVQARGRGLLADVEASSQLLIGSTFEIPQVAVGVPPVPRLAVEHRHAVQCNRMKGSVALIARRRS